MISLEERKEIAKQPVKNIRFSYLFKYKTFV